MGGAVKGAARYTLATTKQAAKVRYGSKAVTALQAESGHSICRPKADPLNVRDGWEEDIGQSARVSHLNDRVNIINRNRKLGFLWGRAT